MGHTSYSVSSRTLRADTSGYATASFDKVFTQQKSRSAHESMLPKNALMRECRDSEAHPNTVPIVLALDVTGSMGQIPHSLIKNGLPKLMGNLIQKGCVDASLLFLAIGDHECDGYPLQVGQFESGDEELDMWLTRTYIEGGGGGNNGESYILALDYAANRIETDAFQKRKEKGFLFIVGDEPPLRKVSANAMKEIYGENQASALEWEKSLKKAKEKFHVFRIQVSDYPNWNDLWESEMGENCLILPRGKYEDIPNLIVDKVIENMKVDALPNYSSYSKPTETVEEML
jgi:uncharacterized protein YegL